MYEQISVYKDIFVENKLDENVNDIFNSYQSAVMSKGALLLAVCRGRLIEGIDFTDDLARGVILIGIPNLPPCTYVNMKLDFLNKIESKLNGTEWFQQ